MSRLKKKDSSWTFNKIADFTVDLIVSEVQQYGAEWIADTSRQDNSITHKETNMYQLLYSDYEWVPGKPLEIHQVNLFQTEGAKFQFNIIKNALEKYFDGYVCRAEIVKMLPHSQIRKHVDGGTFLQKARRCHIPLITNRLVTFSVENDTIHMKVGELYEINNGIRHSVSNESDFERIHMIIDVMPREEILW